MVRKDTNVLSSKKAIFDNKRKLKGIRTVISENLTKVRYRKCQEAFARESCWTIDGKIFCLTGKNKSNGDPEKIVVTKESDLSNYI